MANSNNVMVNSLHKEEEASLASSREIPTAPKINLKQKANEMQSKK